MKKITRILITLIMAVLSLTLFANADVALKLDGKPIPFEQPPVIIEGRTLVPFRAIFEALGAEVEWDDATKTATAVKEDLTVKITIGEKILYKNGEEIELDVPAMIVGEGYTMVPARAIAEAFGVVVEWEDTAQYVILITPTVKDEIPVITMYAADGRTVSVPKTAIEDYKRVGWYIEPVTQMWTVDGVSKYVYKSLVEDYKKLGWYTEPVIRMYAPDGRTIIIAKTVVEDYKKVGWYTEPVTLMYALDGRTKYVVKSQVEASKKVGWYTQPMIMMYAPNGKTIIIAKSAVEDYKKVGWYTEPVVQMWAADGRTKYVIKSQVEANKKVGWYDKKSDIYETVYAPDGGTKEVFKARVAAEKSVGWMDRAEFEEYLQPWVKAYVDVTWHRHFGAKAEGGYFLVRDNKTDKIVYRGKENEYYGSNESREKIDRKYPSDRYTILIGAQWSLKKMSYSSINQVYDFLGKYFSEELYPHVGNYGFYEYNNSLYSNSVCEYGGLVKNGIYLGYKDNHHYVAVITSDWNFSAVRVKIIELTRINNKLLITDCFDQYPDTKNATYLSILKWHYSNHDYDFTKLNTNEIFLLADYLLKTSEKYKKEFVEIYSYSTLSVTNTGNNQYRLYIKKNFYIQDTKESLYIDFIVQNGNPVMTSLKYLN